MHLLENELEEKSGENRRLMNQRAVNSSLMLLPSPSPYDSQYSTFPSSYHAGGTASTSPLRHPSRPPTFSPQRAHPSDQLPPAPPMSKVEKENVEDNISLSTNHVQAIPNESINEGKLPHNLNNLNELNSSSNHHPHHHQQTPHAVHFMGNDQMHMSRPPAGPYQQHHMQQQQMQKQFEETSALNSIELALNMMKQQLAPFTSTKSKGPAATDSTPNVHNSRHQTKNKPTVQNTYSPESMFASPYVDLSSVGNPATSQTDHQNADIHVNDPGLDTTAVSSSSTGDGGHVNYGNSIDAKYGRSGEPVASITPSQHRVGLDNSRLEASYGTDTPMMHHRPMVSHDTAIRSSSRKTKRSSPGKRSYYEDNIGSTGALDSGSNQAEFGTIYDGGFHEGYWRTKYQNASGANLRGRHVGL